MNSVFIDTSALFRAKGIFEKLINEGYDLCISPIVIYEFIKVLDELITEEKNEKRKKLYQKLRNRLPSLLKDLEVRIISHELTHEELEEAYKIMKNKDVDIGDALIYLLMKRKNIHKILTYDHDWDRIDIEIIR